MSSSGISRSSGCGSAPAAAGTVGERIADRPRPMPRGRSATGGHLLGELEVGLRAGAVWVVVDDGTPEARRFAEAHVAGDHRVEDERREVLADLALDVLGQLRA